MGDRMDVINESGEGRHVAGVGRRDTEVSRVDEDSCSRVWSAFADAAPNLCYMGKVRGLLAGLLDKAKDMGDLIQGLESAMAETESASFRTDLKILKQRLDWCGRKGTGKG